MIEYKALGRDSRHIAEALLHPVEQAPVRSVLAAACALHVPDLQRQVVDKLCMVFSLCKCNASGCHGDRVDETGFLPTMKLQPSQLP